MISNLWTLCWFGERNKTWLEWLSNSFMWMTCLSYPIRYLFENFLQVFVSMILEIKAVSNRRNLTETTDIVLMSGGILLNFIYILLWVVLLIWTVVWFYRIFKNRSMLHCLKVGLNPWNWCIWALYYFDYFGFRSIALILLAIDPSQILTWSLILVLYMC